MFPVPKVVRYELRNGCVFPLPPYAGLDKKYKSEWQETTHVACKWVAGTLSDAIFHPKEGINQKEALRAIGTIVNSKKPHREKFAYVAWLLDEWFERVECEYIPSQRGSIDGNEYVLHVSIDDF